MAITANVIVSIR